MGAIWRLGLARGRMGRGTFRRREGNWAGMEGGFLEPLTTWLFFAAVGEGCS